MDYDAQTLSRQLPGFDIHLPGVVSSTQQVAREMVDTGAGAAGSSAQKSVKPVLIVADQQTAGRGRGSNRWLADQGSVAVTFILQSPAAHPPTELPLRAGLAIRDALSAWLDPQMIQIKWPNDVLVQDKKIAGVLCERRHGLDLVGIGLNVQVDFASLAADTDASLAARSTSLHEHVKNRNLPHSRMDVLINLAGEVSKLWDNASWHETLNQVHALTGRDIVVQTADGPLAGVCEGIDAQGRLLLRTGQRLHQLLDGTIQK